MKTTNHNNMIDVFSIALADEYKEAMVHLNKLIRDPTALKPGAKSIVLLTPCNTGWKWDESKQNVKAIERWSDNMQMSEITKPITMDDMIRHFLHEMNDNSLYGEDSSLRYSCQRSFSNLCVVPCKVLKVISQLQGVVEICCRERPNAFIQRESEDLLMLQYPATTDRLYEGKTSLKKLLDGP